MDRFAYYNALVDGENYLKHHGIKGQHWGKKNGPPYPLDYEDLSPKEKKQLSKDEINEMTSDLEAVTKYNKAVNDFQKAQNDYNDAYNKYLNSQKSFGEKIVDKMKQKAVDALIDGAGKGLSYATEQTIKNLTDQAIAASKQQDKDSKDSKSNNKKK